MDVHYELAGLQFAWDGDKEHENVAKHGVAFSEAAQVFLDPLMGYLERQWVEDEERLVAIGMSFKPRLVLVVHTERSTRLRIISARVATRSEREAYERR